MKIGVVDVGGGLRKSMLSAYGGATCLLFPFGEGVALDIGKLAMWRLQSHSTFGGTWLSDYVPNRLGGFLREQEVRKSDCPFIGQDGNIFNLVGIASRTLREHGLSQQAKEMTQKVFASSSCEEALNMLVEYVTITSSRQEEKRIFKCSKAAMESGRKPQRPFCISPGVGQSHMCLVR